MKKLYILLLASSILLSGCSNKGGPTGLDSYVEAHNGSSPTDSGVEIETQEAVYDEIPQNYKNIEGNIFAVVKDGEIIAYKYGKKDGDKWTFVDCDEKGNIITRKVTTTTTQKTDYSTTTTTSSSTTKAMNSSTTTSKQTTKAAQPATKQSAATSQKKTSAQQTKPNTQPTAKPTSKPATQSTSKATSAVPFSYTFINGLSGLPASVKNYFQYYIDRADINSLVTKERIGDNGSLYVMLYMLNGSPVTIRGVQSNGIISYHLGSGTSTVCRIIEIKGFNGKVSYNKV
ncbi:MAG: hypothetical protein J5956_11310 [Ruminococcus sp.]|nr:hypothetical protein [Ruminococcus sp.]